MLLTPLYAGTQTLTTYYPAPQGNYKNISVGNTFTVKSQASACSASGTDVTLLNYNGTLQMCSASGNTNILGLTASPTDPTAAASKAYVDAAAGGVQYMGPSSGVDGRCGAGVGILGCNSTCNSTYPGSHICTQGEIVRSGATSLGTTGWISIDSITDVGSGIYWNGVTGTVQNPPCNNWITNSSAAWGTALNTTGTFIAQTCDTISPIFCCKGG